MKLPNCNYQNIIFIADAYNTDDLINAKSFCQKTPTGFSPEDLPLRKNNENSRDQLPPEKDNKKKIKDFLSLNKLLWLKLFSFKGKKDNDLEKGFENVIKSSQEYDTFSPSTDDISSEIFFDHIEAFAFDLNDVPDQNDQKKCEFNEVSQGTIANSEGTPSSNKKYKNNLDLYRNYKNSRLLTGKTMFNTFEDELEICQKQNENSLTKKRPSKLRRLSSSILSKDKKPLTFSRKENHSKSKKRRPLRRQKQVEKEKRSKIQEKYQNKSFQEDLSVCSDSHRSTVEVLNTSIAYNDEGSNDVYLSVIKTPVTSRASSRKVVNVSSSHYKAVLRPRSVSKKNTIILNPAEHIQQFEDSKIKIIVPSVDTHGQCDPDISNVHQIRTSYSKCEVLTDV